MPTDTTIDTEASLGKVRHPIDLPSLERYLTASYPSQFTAPFTIKQFGFGQSNPSYQICDADGRKFVLRKKPAGKLVSKTAHAVDREFYMLQALNKLSESASLENTNNTKKNPRIPVPKVICLCQDESVIGTEFYIMEFMKGRIFHFPSMPDLSPKDRKECWQSAITTLANLHSVDPTQLPKMFTSKRLESHFPRQLGSLSAVANAQASVTDLKTGEKVGPIPQIDDIVKWMKNHLPRNDCVSIVHGDYKIDNLIFHPTENRVIAILDWELCTVGHPLADLANLLQPFSWPEDLFGKNIGLKDTKEPLPEGLITVDEALQLYRQVTGYDAAKDWTFAQVSAHFRLSVIAHGIKARLFRGQASSANASDHVKTIDYLSKLALDEIKGKEKAKI